LSEDSLEEERSGRHGVLFAPLGLPWRLERGRGPFQTEFGDELETYPPGPFVRLHVGSGSLTVRPFRWGLYLQWQPQAVNRSQRAGGRTE
jgi:hypothetical protein